MKTEDSSYHGVYQLVKDENLLDSALRVEKFYIALIELKYELHTQIEVCLINQTGECREIEQ